jgi:ribulose-phosphate 3-epimerase
LGIKAGVTLNPATPLVALEEILLEVDGGICPKNATEVVTAGATVLVAGSAVFGGPKSIAQNMADLRAAIGN